jgi:hypothetical protein
MRTQQALASVPQTCWALLGIIVPEREWAVQRISSRERLDRLAAVSADRRIEALQFLAGYDLGTFDAILACYLTLVSFVVLKFLCCPVCRGDMRRPPLDDLRVPAQGESLGRGDPPERDNPAKPRSLTPGSRGHGSRRDQRHLRSGRLQA